MEREEYERLARLEERLDAVIKGQDVIFQKLDRMDGRKLQCPMGEDAHKEMNFKVCAVEERVDCLEQARAGDEGERRAQRRMNATLIAISSIVVGVITWVATIIANVLMG